MILLDTNHASVLKYTENPQCVRLLARLDAAPDRDLALTIVSAEEQLRGWLARIHGERDLRKQVPHYEQLGWLIDFFRRWRLTLFDAQAAEQCLQLRRQRLRLGTMDLKIAAIALTHNALLLSANLRDFRKVPGLRVENWLA